MEADGPGEYVRIPAEVSLNKTVPVALLNALRSHGLPSAAYKFRWIDEWRTVMFAPPQGTWSGTSAQALVIEITLSESTSRSTLATTRTMTMHFGSSGSREYRSVAELPCSGALRRTRQASDRGSGGSPWSLGWSGSSG